MGDPDNTVPKQPLKQNPAPEPNGENGLAEAGATDGAPPDEASNVKGPSPDAQVLVSDPNNASDKLPKERLTSESNGSKDRNQPMGTAPGNNMPPGKTPTIEAIHRDLAFANAYRQEFIKSLILVAGALFAFSVSFRPELRSVAQEWLFWVAWIELSISVLGGFAQLAAWERFYASYQRFEHKGKDGKADRKGITCWRRFALFCQVSGFIIGVAALGSFTALNLTNVEKKAGTKQTELGVPGPTTAGI